jgi:fatty-acyl-CoA synthase
MVEGSRWVLTGDRARIDTTGEYVVLGRGSQCINTGGEKVYPEEVEETARRYPPVQDVVVVGLPDERWGSKVVAVVQVQQGHEFDLQEFEKICRSNLSGYSCRVPCIWPRKSSAARQARRITAGPRPMRPSMNR